MQKQIKRGKSPVVVKTPINHGQVVNEQNSNTKNMAGSYTFTTHPENPANWTISQGLYKDAHKKKNPSNIYPSV